jgi:inosine/xanthosine triphosphate pyrophosphatase family protein/dephospho-CoA kinase
MRPYYGNAFRFERVLSTFFYTSNLEKLLQARLVFSRFGYQLRHFRGRQEPYEEDETLDTQTLLQRAVRQVALEFGVRSLFFVEDTSLRIDALSESMDFPGLSVKRWFAATSFAEVDRQIELRGGNRRCTVKSDIALHMPGLSRPLFFHGETSGTIAPSAPAFKANVQYPWLTPTTFNGWFVPDGALQRLGEMEFEASLSFDFRVKALISLMQRLEELNASINLGPAFYTVRRGNEPLAGQLLLPGSGQRVLIIVGHKCAGKTTLSDHLASRADTTVFEASTVLRDFAAECGVTLQSSESASLFLRQKGMDIIARKIGEYLELNSSSLRVITGFRTIEELLYIRKKFPSARVILVEADEKLRFERHIRRAREGEPKTFVDFQEQDEAQRRFGVMRVSTEIADSIISNDGDFETFTRRVDHLITSLMQGSIPQAEYMSELHRCLSALGILSRVATCEEISDFTAKFGEKVRVYNTNRALKEVPEFAERVEKRGDALLSYKITERGRLLLQLLNLARQFTSSLRK